MTNEKMQHLLVLEARCYVAMAEIDYDLRQWQDLHGGAPRIIDLTKLARAAEVLRP